MAIKIHIAHIVVLLLHAFYAFTVSFSAWSRLQWNILVYVYELC